MARHLSGFVELSYRNHSPDTLRKIYLLVPSNAFHDQENSAVREMRRFTAAGSGLDNGAGYKLTILSLQFLSIGENIEFPLQAYDFSDTVLELTLPYALLPGDSLTLGLNFRQDFSRAIPRDFILWFPQVAVYDEKGWHPEPFHFLMQPDDVYTEFADFDVRITLPGNYVVVAPGEVATGDPGWQSVSMDTSDDEKSFTAQRDSLWAALKARALRNGPRTVRYRGKNMRTFVWSASPDFVHIRPDSSSGHHFFISNHRDLAWVKDVLTLLPKVQTFLREYFGRLPGSRLLILEADEEPFAVPGMLALEDAGEFDIPFYLCAVYFPGQVAHNGVSEAWLPRGLQVFVAKAFLQKVFGPKGYDIREAQEDMSWIERRYPLPSVDDALRTLTLLYNASGQNEPISKEIHKYSDPLSAVMNIYAKAEIFYEMLQYVVGDSLFKASLRKVVADYRYRHIDAVDLQHVFEAVSGQELGWFFRQWLHGTPTVDYAKASVTKHRRDDGTWVTEVKVKRRGDGIMPVEVEVETLEGKPIRKRWDGKATEGTVVFETAEKPKSVEVDPQDRIMDSNRLNNTGLRIEVLPDWPLLRYIHMPNDALLILWRPLLDYNAYDGVRLGLRSGSSYRAFYHNLTLETMFALGSLELDATARYSNPLSHKSLFNRYEVMIRKNEGRFETDAHLMFSGADGLISKSGRQLRLGLNFSALLNSNYTFREVASDTGTVQFPEWQDVDVLLAYVGARGAYSGDAIDVAAQVRAEQALPGGDVQFTKLNSRLQVMTTQLGFKATLRGNLATSFGRDDLPLQDRFSAEGAGARQRFQNDVVKTVNSASGFARRYVPGGGFLRGYHGQPLPATRYATLNAEVGTAGPVFLGLRVFGFWDTGRIWQPNSSGSVVRSDAGFGLSFLGDTLDLLGGNLSLFADFALKAYFPIWLSHPLPGEPKTQFRWMLSIGKGL